MAVAQVAPSLIFVAQSAPLTLAISLDATAASSRRSLVCAFRYSVSASRRSTSDLSSAFSVLSCRIGGLETVQALGERLHLGLHRLEIGTRRRRPRLRAGLPGSQGQGSGDGRRQHDVFHDVLLAFLSAEAGAETRRRAALAACARLGRLYMRVLLQLCVSACPDCDIAAAKRGASGARQSLRAAEMRAGRKVQVKLLPFPSTLVTSSRPPWRCSACLTMARPRPEPPSLRERPASTR